MIAVPLLLSVLLAQASAAAPPMFTGTTPAVRIASCVFTPRLAGSFAGSFAQLDVTFVNVTKMTGNAIFFQMKWGGGTAKMIGVKGKFSPNVSINQHAVFPLKNSNTGPPYNDPELSAASATAVSGATWVSASQKWVPCTTAG